MSLIEKLYIYRQKLTFFPWNRWAKAYLSSKGVQFVDKDSVRFLGHCYLRVSDEGVVKIGRGFVCRSGWEYSFDNYSGSKIVVNSGATLTVGENSGISNALIYCNERINIGDNVKIGGGCWIFDSNFHSVDFKERRDGDLDWKGTRTLPVSIGNDVFVGSRSIICKGVSIGDRTIIQAGSVVVKSIPADCIAGGNPCEVLKKLVD